MNTGPTLNLKTVMIAEDYELSRLGLSVALKQSKQVTILAEVENGALLLSEIEKLQPQLILMDINMPVKNGIETTREIKTRFPDIKIIMLTSHDQEIEVQNSLGAGADAYCLKDIKICRLLQIMDLVIDGAIVLGPAIGKNLITKSCHQTLKLTERDSSSNSSKLNHSFITSSRHPYNQNLTQRELEVLKFMVNGDCNKLIAGNMDITIHTVKAHVCSIIHKLDVEDRTQAALKALKDGLII